MRLLGADGAAAGALCKDALRFKLEEVSGRRPTAEHVAKGLDDWLQHVVAGFPAHADPRRTSKPGAGRWNVHPSVAEDLSFTFEASGKLTLEVEAHDAEGAAERQAWSPRPPAFYVVVSMPKLVPSAPRHT